MIQRAHRQARLRRTIRQRYTLLKIVHDCKAVFDTRNSVIRAATTLQRAWRDYVRRRKEPKAVDWTKLAQDVNVKGSGRNKLPQAEEDGIDIWLS